MVICSNIYILVHSSKTPIDTEKYDGPIVYKNNALMNKIFCIITVWPEMVICSNIYILLQSSKTPIDTEKYDGPIVYKNNALLNKIFCIITV